jgi:hypothetical protein
MSKARDLASGQNGVRPYATASGLLTVAATASSQSYTVTLPSGRFSVAPIVTLGQNVSRGVTGYINTSSSSTSISLAVYTTTTSGPTTGAGNINWVAIQMTSTTAEG